MKKDVIVNINSRQDWEDAESDHVELTTTGIFYKKNDKFYLMYEESDELEKVKTTLKISDDTVTLIRGGETPTQMIFKQGEHNIGLYETIAGTYTLGIKTKRIMLDLSDNGGDIEVEYHIELDQKITGYNILKINIGSAK